jgi:hypothetical protein
METRSVLEGCKTLLTLTARYSSSARLDFLLTLIFIEGSVTLEHSINVLWGWHMCWGWLSGNPFKFVFFFKDLICKLN